MTANYTIGQNGLPVPESMRVSKRSLVRCLFESTPYVTLDVARLWARTGNSSEENAVSRAVSRAREAAYVKPCTRGALKGHRFRQARRRLAMLTVMGLMFPGTKAFKEQRGYVLFPSDSQALVGTQRSHPFGALILGDMVHLFAESEDLRSAARGIHEILIHFHEHHPHFKCCIHLLYRELPPNHHETFDNRWPLIVIPSLLAYWLIDGNGLPTHLDFIDPFFEYTGPKYEGWHGSIAWSERKNWAGWLDLCRRVRTTLPSKMRLAKWLPIAPTAVFNTEISERRQAAHDRGPQPEFTPGTFGRIVKTPRIRAQFKPRTQDPAHTPSVEYQSMSIEDVFVPEPMQPDIPE